MRVRLLKSYHFKLKRKPWPRGSVIQITNEFASELFAEGIAEPYYGEYPPKEKMKMEVMKIYSCPMHSDVTSNKPGKCTKCGMDLKKRSN